jgi:A/G-specific adenine glycosylase
MTATEIAVFTETLWNYYAQHGRHDLPWRQAEPDGSFDPYKIMVSELMLQQTQVTRVLPKFNEFLMKFPTVSSLAQAPLSDVLLLWSGLGYNRRAKFLWQAAQTVQTDMQGEFPRSLEQLVALPGVGANTAGAILTYTFNEPVTFLETNIRTVYIHHFFADQTDVPDAAIVEWLTATLDREQPREFYWALMDYGTHLKQTVGNLSRRSKGYVKQSKFDGSRRQIRGQVMRLLSAGPATLNQLQAVITDKRLPEVMTALTQEGLIQSRNDHFSL